MNRQKVHRLKKKSGEIGLSTTYLTIKVGVLEGTFIPSTSEKIMMKIKYGVNSFIAKM